MVSEDFGAMRPHDAGRVVLSNYLDHGVGSPQPEPLPQAALVLKNREGAWRRHVPFSPHLHIITNALQDPL